MTQARRPLMLMILDGWGYRRKKKETLSWQPALLILTGCKRTSLVLLETSGSRRTAAGPDGKL